jgi:hypothetical protein
MAEVLEGYDYMVGVVWRWVDAAIGPMAALASALLGEGCRWCTITLRALPALC